jgi:hypothetical protein
MLKMDELEACGMFESSAIVETSYNSGDSIGNFSWGRFLIVRKPPAKLLLNQSRTWKSLILAFGARLRLGMCS